MAFADLQPNQMVDENNAATGGFTSIGPKNPATQCYSKAQALAAYNLSASAMNGYADNQLVPKEVWVTGAIYGGAMTLNVPGVGNNIPPNAPGSGVISGYTLNGGITINNTSSTETVLFKSASLSNPYPILAQSGAARLMQHTSTTVVNINTAPSDGEFIPPNSFATWVSFGKQSGSGLVVLSLETQTTGGGRQQVFWTFSI